MRNNIFFYILILIFLIISCDKNNPTEHQKEISYDGLWKGNFSSGDLSTCEFNVKNNYVTNFSVSQPTDLGLKFYSYTINEQILSDGSFKGSGSKNGYPNLEVNGKFTSERKATGSIKLTGAVMTWIEVGSGNWSATKN